MTTYRMGATSPFPHMPRDVAWLVSAANYERGLGGETVFVFAASERGARAKGAKNIGYFFEETRASRVPELDDLPRNYTPRDVLARGCGWSCECERIAYDYDEPEFDEHGNIVSCEMCREESES